MKFSAAGKNILERLAETDKTTSKGGSIKFHVVWTFEAVLIESFSYRSRVKKENEIEMTAKGNKTEMPF